MTQGQLFVVSAPSGAGKSSLIKAALADPKVNNLVYAISHTTRPPRGDENNGVDYYFVSEEQFLRMVESGDFLEWTRTYGNYYGTSRKKIQELLINHNVITDVDVVGGRAFREAFPAAILIFVIPPALSILKERLKNRGTNTEEETQLRLNHSLEEIREYRLYDFLLVNNEFEKTASELVEIINTGKGTTVEGQEEFWKKFSKS
ncbi:MAG: guanylate kinase [Deltaproteobacteria bacterium]|jgi:guanylate kinase|nr:guanylate kinase [Deltaproteobacteria bacterium]